jgi:hypothetical protein
MRKRMTQRFVIKKGLVLGRSVDSKDVVRFNYMNFRFPEILTLIDF